MTAAALLLCGAGAARAGTDTWLGASNNSWSDSANWSPAKPADGDSLLFGPSPRTTVLADFSSRPAGAPDASDPQTPLALQSISFAAGAPAYTIELYSDFTGTLVYNANLALTGVGIANLSGQTQTFVLDHGTTGINTAAAPASTITFNNAASAGDAAYTLKGGEVTPLDPTGVLRSDAAAVFFRQTASAGTATFTANGGAGNGARWARVEFHDTSSANAATFVNEAGRLGANFKDKSPPQVEGFGGQTNFYDSAVAGTAHFTNKAGTPTGGGSAGGAQFFDTASADHATFTNAGVLDLSPSGQNLGTGGFTAFAGSATAGHATFTNQAGQGAAGRGQTGFFDTSTAGNGTFINAGGDDNFSSGGVTFFRDNATAGNGTFENHGTGQLSGAGGQTFFFDNSNAGTGTFTNVGGVFGPPGTIEFRGTSSAASGTFFTTSDRGGILNFWDASTAGQGKFFAQGASGTLVFHNNATAANATFNLSSNTASGAFLQFRDNSTAANATIDVGTGSNLQFYETSTADHANITVRGFGAGPGGGNGSLLVVSTLGNAIVNLEGATQFGGTLNVGGANASIGGAAATAANAVITVKGGTGTDNAGARLLFTSGATAGNATVITNGGTAGGSGGFTFFSGGATGGTARIVTNAGGTFDVSHNTADAQGNPSPAGTAVGSIEGAGTYILGATLLSTGSRNASTVVSGLITDGGPNFGTGGMLTVTGGKLTLTGANTYTGATNIGDGLTPNSGTLAPANTTGSATGTGPVFVNFGGTLGGGGAIAGPVTLKGGVIAPGDPVTLTLQNNLTWDGGGVIRLVLGPDQASSDLLSILGSLARGCAGQYRFDLIDAGAVIGQSYDLIRFGSLQGFSAGDFTTTGPVAGNFTLTNGALAMTLNTVPEPGAVPLLLAGALLARRHRGAVHRPRQKAKPQSIA